MYRFATIGTKVHYSTRGRALKESGNRGHPVSTRRPWSEEAFDDDGSSESQSVAPASSGVAASDQWLRVMATMPRAIRQARGMIPMDKQTCIPFTGYFRGQLVIVHKRVPAGVQVKSSNPRICHLDNLGYENAVKDVEVDCRDKE